jgi:hypothetical protein
MCPPENSSKVIALSDSQKKILAAAMSGAREEIRQVDGPLFSGVKGIAEKRPVAARELSFIL